MKEIQLTQGKVALVDDEDYEWLNVFKWHASRGNNTFYARRHIVVNGKWKKQNMQADVMGEQNLGIMIDHIDGNGLNNQSSNLRSCTAQENQMNRRKSDRNFSSMYKGVSWFKRTKRWMAYIKINQKRYYLGYFDIEEDAAKAYDVSAIERFGEFAKLNFPQN